MQWGIITSKMFISSVLIVEFQVQINLLDCQCYNKEVDQLIHEESNPGPPCYEDNE